MIKERASGKLYRQDERITVGLLGILLFLMLGMVAFTTANTFRAVKNLQQHVSAVKAGDVTTIRPWMTIRVVSHIYNVPEDYLYRSLNIDNPVPFHHATLWKIATHQRKSVQQVIGTLQQAILIYRKKHPDSVTPTPEPASKRRLKGIQPTPGG